MFPDDPDLLLKLAACCKILLAGTIDLNALPRAQQLLEDYLAGFLKVFFTLSFAPPYFLKHNSCAESSRSCKTKLPLHYPHLSHYSGLWPSVRLLDILV
jgi:hypothetical protein